MKKRNKTAVVLNDLIHLCRDGEKGYRDAAESLKSGYHKMLFQEFARKRSAFGTVLQGYVRAYGGDPEHKGSMIGSIHRGWMNLESEIAKNDEHAIISECERGEEFALKHYKTACSADLPEDVLSVVWLQTKEIEEALNKVKAMSER
jgi:uncharacterized protein (TIGR02284 family)